MLLQQLLATGQKDKPCLAWRLEWWLNKVDLRPLISEGLLEPIHFEGLLVSLGPDSKPGSKGGTA